MGPGVNVDEAKKHQEQVSEEKVEDAKAPPADDLITVSARELEERTRKLVEEAAAKAAEAALAKREAEAAPMRPQFATDDQLLARMHSSPPVDEWEKRYRPETVLFAKSLANPQAFHYLMARRFERAALAGEASDSSGGEYAIPEEFLAVIVDTLVNKVRIYPLCNVMNPTERKGTIPVVSTDVSVAWTGEKVDLTESSLVLTRDQWNAYKCGAYSKITREMVEDSGVDLIAYLGERFGKKLAEERDKKVLAGTGSSQPEGFYSKSGVGTYSVGGALSYDALVETLHTLGPEYRGTEAGGQPEAYWFMSDTNCKRIRKLKDSDNHPLFKWDPTQKFGTMLLGHPLVNVDDYIGNDRIVFGNPKYEWVMPRKGMTVELSTEATDASGNSAFLQHEIWLKVLERWDSQCVLAAAFVLGTGITG